MLPDSDRCVAISTRSSVTEMIAPGAYAILSPMIIGFTDSRNKNESRRAFISSVKKQGGNT